jgi:hypothetical protein
MVLFFRLPFLLLELVLRQGAGALRVLLRVARGDGADTVVTPAAGAATAPPPASPEPAPPSPPPPTAEEAIERRFEREAAAPAPPPAPPPHAVRDTGHVDREAAVVESVGPARDVAGTMTVDRPWDGYDTMAASAIVARLRDADSATRGVVRMYEQQHKRRATVLRATD